jgi:hypothetical protein
VPKNANLKPLQEDIHGTGKWNFSGKNLPPDEVQALADKGVDWEKDIMPDGRLKLPKFRNRWRKSTVLEPTVAEGDLETSQKARWEEYQALEDPKPDYFEWASQRDRREQYDGIEDIFKNAGRASDRLKALALMLEFSKSKPKQVHEVSEATPQLGDVPMDEVLRGLLEVMGISYEKWQRFLATDDDIDLITQ